MDDDKSFQLQLAVYQGADLVAYLNFMIIFRAQLNTLKYSKACPSDLAKLLRPILSDYEPRDFPHVSRHPQPELLIAEPPVPVPIQIPEPIQIPKPMQIPEPPVPEPPVPEPVQIPEFDTLELTLTDTSNRDPPTICFSGDPTNHSIGL
ncbi:hypothetical protein TNIN_264831 [Trichonephila inaurata madagascariensis]|uniref:Uncharacterized protein n=1 Tax=Trichonephila inaurata madagascariensis TaxID=2747483 RepID=A0A8X6IYN9_9ARAC|nr:hypothetical protein TNIN_264831 [Trichonephila inaurata madagascariensis]